jgi:hypothetical protein
MLTCYSKKYKKIPYVEEWKQRNYFIMDNLLVNINILKKDVDNRPFDIDFVVIANMWEEIRTCKCGVVYHAVDS